MLLLPEATTKLQMVIVTGGSNKGIIATEANINNHLDYQTVIDIGVGKTQTIIVIFERVDKMQTIIVTGGDNKAANGYCYWRNYCYADQYQ